MTTQELIAKSQAGYADFMFWWYTDLVVIILSFIVAIYASVRILRRMGLSGFWSILVVFYPPIGLLVLAFRRWPKLDGEREEANLPS